MTSVTCPPKSSTETVNALATFVECVFEPDDITEVRLVPSGKQSWHRAADLHNETERLLKENSRKEHIYVGVNPRHEVGGSTAEDVLLARSLWVDLDGGCTEAEAKERIKNAELPFPTLFIESGGGCHAYWRLWEPIIDLEEFTHRQKQLIAALGGDGGIHDPPRIMRLPGFLNCKAKYGEPRPCRIIAADPERRYDLTEVVGHLPEVKEEKTLPIGNNGAPATAGLSEYARAAAYVAKIPCEGEGGRNDAAFRVAALLTKDFNLAIGGARQILSMWNQGNNPPLPDDELADVLQHAAQYGDHAPGQKLNEPPKSRMNGTSHNDVAHGQHDTPKGTAKPKRLTYLTGEQLRLENYPLVPLVENVFYAHHTGVIAALEKNGKTTAALHLSLCLATGNPFLGRFNVPEPKKVIFYSGESGEATLIQNGILMCESMGEELTKVENFILSPTVPRIGDVSYMAEFAADMQDMRPAVVIIDPFNKALACDKPGDMFAVGKLLLEAQEICKPIGATLFYVHHVRKPDRMNRGAALTLQDLAFSGLSQDVRQWLLIERREEFKPGQAEKFTYRSGGSPNGLGGVWDVDMGKYWHDDPTVRYFSMKAVDSNPEAGEEAKRHAKAAAEQVQLSADVKELIEAAGKFRDGETKSVIRDLTTLRGARLEKAVASALLSGKLVHCEVWKSNRKTPLDGLQVAQKKEEVKQSADSAEELGSDHAGW